MIFKPGSSQNRRFQEETGEELSSQNVNLPVKIESWNICYKEILLKIVKWQLHLQPRNSSFTKLKITVTANWLCRSKHQTCSMKKDVLRNFTKFTGKQLCQSIFFNKVAGAAWKRDSGTGVFLWILRNF